MCLKFLHAFLWRYANKQSVHCRVFRFCFASVGQLSSPTNWTLQNPGPSVACEPKMEGAVGEREESI